MTARELKKSIFKFFRPILNSPDLKLRGLSDDEILEEEYKFFFENNSYKNENSLYKIYINNNLPT